MAIVDLYQVEALNGASFNSTDRQTAMLLIDMVQSEIEAYLNRSVEIRTFVKEKVYVDSFQPYSYLFVQNSPIVSVSQLNLNGVTVTTDRYTVEPWGILYYGSGLDFVTNSPNWVISPINAFEVTYRGGLDGTKINAIQMVLIKKVLQEMAHVHAGESDRLGYSSMRVEDFSWTKAGNSSKSTSSSPINQLWPELKLLDRYRKRLAS
jgi:hypothetical protein